MACEGAFKVIPKAWPMGTLKASSPGPQDGTWRACTGDTWGGQSDNHRLRIQPLKVGDTRGGQMESLSGPSRDQAKSGLHGSWGKAKTREQVLPLGGARWDR